MEHLIWGGKLEPYGQLGVRAHLKHTHISSEKGDDFSQCTEHVSSKGFCALNPGSLAPRQVFFPMKLSRGMWAQETQVDFLFKLSPLLSSRMSPAEKRAEQFAPSWDVATPSWGGGGRTGSSSEARGK